MKSIKEKFNLIQKKYPYWSSWVQFYQLIIQFNLTKDLISHYFSKFVEKSDYPGMSRRDALEHFGGLAKN